MLHIKGNAGKMNTKAHSISFLMKLITDRATTLFTMQEELPITVAQCRVLMYLEACGGGPISQKELERHLGVTHTTAKGLLQRLEEKDFVRTAFDSSDGRVKNAYLTEKSGRFRDQMLRNTEALRQRMLNGVSDEEIDVLVDLLERIYHNIK